MAFHNELGKSGEEISVTYLKTKGYQILETNWRHGHEEIDIIAQQNNELVIVEVKSRSSKYLLPPEVAVTKAKQKLLITATAAYIRQKQIKMDTRFDILAVVFNKDAHEINHIENAFYPGL